MEPAHSPVAVRRVAVEATRPLRSSVLRPGLPPESSLYAGDDDIASAHFAAFDGDEIVGVASLYAESRPDGPDRGWRLRGMATAPSHRRQGIGRAVLAACIEHAVREGGSELWCNARVAAVPLYRQARFEVVSGEFDIPCIGPHVVMRLDLARP